MSRVARLRVLGMALGLSLMLALAGCGGGSGGGDQGGGGGGDLSGNIEVEGSSTVQPITQGAAEAFAAENPGVNITVGGKGTGDGFEAFCAGNTQISDASRPIDQEEEVPLCEENGVDFVELPVATDGLSVVVNPQNEAVSEITIEELKTMWEPAAEGQITRWNQVNPQWPDQEFELFGPGTESGTFDFFTEEVVGEEGASRTDYNPSEDDNVLVQGVAGSENALGYFGFSFYDLNKDKLKALSVDGVEPTKETIRSGEYPLSRPLFIYVSTQALEDNRALEEFVNFYLTEENLNQIVEQADYVTLDPETAQQVRTQLEDRTTGTIYDENGDLPGGDVGSALEQSQ